MDAESKRRLSRHLKEAIESYQTRIMKLSREIATNRIQRDEQIAAYIDAQEMLDRLREPSVKINHGVNHG